MFEIWMMICGKPYCLKVDGLPRAQFAWDTCAKHFEMMSARP